MGGRRRNLIELSGLAALERKAVAVYDGAIHAISVTPVRERLREFCREHEQRLPELAEAAGHMRGALYCVEGIPEASAGGLEAARGEAGSAVNIELMRRNEEFMAATYAGLDRRGHPEGIRTLLARWLDEESAHAAYFRRCVEERVWETFIMPVR